VLSEEDLLLIVSHGEFAKKNLYGNTLWILIAMLLIVVFHDRFFSKIIAKIIEILTDSLEATSHSRVAYPWQEKNKR
jgi:hypothetical protein